MKQVNLAEAKSSLSRLVEDIESGREKEIVIARDGRPAARLVPLMAAGPTGRRIGIEKGAFEMPDEIDAHNDDIAALFGGSGE